MENQSILSKKDAQKLFQLAKEYHEIKPWRWLKASDLFGIKLEDIEEIIFCSVLGNDEKARGMAFYIGAEGIESYFRILKGQFDLQAEMIHIENSIVMYFDDEKDLGEEDYELIRYAGVELRGKKAWPNFRKYEPGLVPRILKEEELLLISRALDVVNDTILNLKDQQYKVEVKETEECYVVEAKREGKYGESFLKYDRLIKEKEKNRILPKNYDELELQRIKKICIRTASIWEMDTFNFSVSVDEEGVPYFPAVLLMVDTESQRIIGNHVSHPSKTASEWQKYLLKWIQDKEILPRKIIMSNTKLMMDVRGMLDKLGVKIEVREKLNYIPAIKKEHFTKII